MIVFAAMFHHFHDGKKHIPSQGSMNASVLNQLLDFLGCHYSILHPVEYSEKVVRGLLEPLDICLTFDDALKAQVEIAFPVLQQKQLHAFFFVYSTAVTGPPDSLELFRDFRHREFTDIETFYLVFFSSFQREYPEHFLRYRNGYPPDYLKEFSFYTDMDRRYRFARDHILSREKYESLLFSMMEESGYSIARQSEKLFMTEDDLQLLCKSGHVIGLHSHTHPTTIDTLACEVQQEEYTKNKRVVEECTGQKVWAMSHPCGRYTEETLRILQEMGIKVGFRSSLSVEYIRSSLEVPREDHVNLVKMMNSSRAECC